MEVVEMLPLLRSIKHRFRKSPEQSFGQCLGQYLGQATQTSSGKPFGKLARPAGEMLGWCGLKGKGRLLRWGGLTSLVIGSTLFLSRGNLVAQAPAINCQDPQGTPEFNYCAQENYSAVDAKLNEVYQDLKGQLSAASQDKLTDAELAWIAYRDAHCAFEVRGSMGGTGYPAYLSDCLAHLTEQRTDELALQMGMKL